MNAHADMFIVVGHNELNTPRGIYRSLALGYEILQDSKLPKQAPINAFYYVCKPFWGFRPQSYYNFFNCARVKAKKSHLCENSINGSIIILSADRAGASLKS